MERDNLRRQALNEIISLPLTYICKHCDLSTVEEILEYIRSKYCIDGINYVTLSDLQCLLEYEFAGEIEISGKIIHTINWKD